MNNSTIIQHFLALSQTRELTEDELRDQEIAIHLGLNEDPASPYAVEEEEEVLTLPIEKKTMTTNTATTNTSSLTSIVAANLYHKLGCTQQATMAAAAIVDACEDKEHFVDTFIDTLEQSEMQIRTIQENGKYAFKSIEVKLDEVALEATMIELEYMTEDGEVGAKLIELLEMRKEAYAPTKVGTVFNRKFANYGIEKGQMSALGVESILALEATQFTIDDYMVSIGNQVQALTGGPENDDEAYVLAGCNDMMSDLCYTSEYKADRRSRLYQAACHGPNGQASDRSRAFMDLAGVTRDYDVPTVSKAIMAEIMDMTKDVKAAAKLRNEQGDVQFIIGQLDLPKKDRLVAKPWSFVKAARIMKELKLGNKPYIGMAVGLDAKCSGPQLGALMTGDLDLAGACGMTLSQVDDAYERAITELTKVGLAGFTRAGVKKAYMGVFYGQGWAAFTDATQLTKDEQFEILDILYAKMPNGDYLINDESAKRFHKAIQDSFGSKLRTVRDRFKAFAGKVEGRTSHHMPDGFKIQMNYKVKFNILNEAIEHGVESPDVMVNTPERTHKFIGLALKSLTVHTGDFIRNGFVNMIQGNDALVAKLIIVHLKRLGAQHIIAVHDCFRVNVTEMHLLEQAIKNTYMDLYGNTQNTFTKDLPLGTDILGLYFTGMEKSLIEGERVVPMSQFRRNKSRKMVDISKTIQALGKSYYFAK
jgi:hypothetical protein